MNGSMAHVRDIQYYTFNSLRILTGDELLQYVFEYYKKHFNERPFIGGYTSEIIKDDENGTNYYYKVEVITIK
jgi:hypothetical protein